MAADNDVAIKSSIILMPSLLGCRVRLAFFGVAADWHIQADCEEESCPCLACGTEETFMFISLQPWVHILEVIEVFFGQSCVHQTILESSSLSY